MFLSVQQVFKGTLELCIMSLDLSLSHCSEIGFYRVETCGSLARQLVQSRDISRLRELAFVNWVTALIKNLFVCVLFWMLSNVRPPRAVRGECCPHVSGSSCTSFLAAKPSPGAPECGEDLGPAVAGWYLQRGGSASQCF